MYEAKTQLSRLVERAAAGEEIVIGRHGRPVARLVPYREERSSRTPGSWRGRVVMSADFDDLPHEIDAAFRGESE